MSNLWLNIRFGVWHIQIVKGSFKPRLLKNDYHAGKPFKIEIYELRFPF